MAGFEECEDSELSWWALGDRRFRLSSKFSMTCSEAPWLIDPDLSERLGKVILAPVAPGYIMWPSDSTRSSCSEVKGEQWPLTVLASELVRVRNELQASKSSLLWEFGLPSQLEYWETGLPAPPSTPSCRDIWGFKKHKK